MDTTWGPEFVTDPTAETEVHPVDEEMAREADAEDDVLDILDRAIAVARPAVVEGMQLVRRQLVSVLDARGRSVR